MRTSNRKVDQLEPPLKNFNEKYSMHKIVMSFLGDEVVSTSKSDLQLEELQKMLNNLTKKITHFNKQFQIKKKVKSSKAFHS